MYEYEYYYYDYANYFDEYDYDYLEVRTNLLFIFFCNYDNGWFSRNRHQEAGRGEQQVVMRQGRNKEKERERKLQGRVRRASRAIVQ